eukprot:EG_transcript_14708
MQRLNTIHISVLETRAFPDGAAYITAHCGSQKVRLANLNKGKLAYESGGSLIGVESAEAIWINVYDSGVTFDSVLGSCMLLLTMFDLQQRPYEGWLPVLNLQGGLVGRFAVQIFGDWSERVTVGVLRATITDRADFMSEGDPYVELRLRDEKRTTTTRHETRNPVWDEHFKFFVGSRDRLVVSVFDQDTIIPDKFGSAEVLGIDIIKRKGESIWVPILNNLKQETCKVLIKIEPDQWTQLLPVRILQAKGMASGDIGSASDMYVTGKCGEQTFKTTVKGNTNDAVWDEEFQLEVRQFDALHLSVMDKDVLFDDALGEAFIPVGEMLAHIGEQVWVDLTGTNGRHNGKLLLWIQPPPGSVYPDTLSRKRLVAYENWDAPAADRAGAAAAAGG